MLVDSHCHLDYLARDGDLDEVVARARRAGVGRMLTICTKVSEFDVIAGIAETYEDVWCSAGIHPHEAATEPAVTVDDLVTLARHPKAVGIGETGLDYYYEHSPRDVQQAQFRTHIAAARKTGLPLIVHTRDADDDTADILEDEYAKGPFTGVIHCFSTGRTLAERALEIGFYISLSGIVTFKQAEDLRETVRALPLERLLVESDAPYLAPVPKRGKRNEPAYVAHTASAVADLKGVTNDTLSAVTTDNFFNLFHQIKRQPSA
jgi:TatD DNase family protein